MEMTCQELTSDPDKKAPVSGARCRDCGKNAMFRPSDEVWTILNSAAYCPVCAAERAKEQP